MLRLPPVVSLDTWYNSGCNNPRHSETSDDPNMKDGGAASPVFSEGNIVNLLDVRSEVEHQEQHIGPAAAPDTDPAAVRVNVVHIPLEELKRRRYELPPRHKTFAILVSNPEDPQNLGLLEECLTAGGNAKPAAANAKKKRKREVSQQKPWNVLGIISGTDPETWKHARILGILRRGKEEQHFNVDNKSLFQPQSRLWEPDRMVQDWLLPLVLEKQKSCSDSIEIWDLGAGSGRDCCFLAEELKAHAINNRIRIVAMDQRYGDLERDACRDFWTRRGVGDCVSCMQIDLNNQESLQRYAQQQQSWNSTTTSLLVVYAVRFWNRSLVQNLLANVLRPVKEANSLPGPTTVIFALSHFGKPSLGAEWNFEHPKEKHVLERNELSRMFASVGEGVGASAWRIHQDRVVGDGDHGRTLIQFVAELSRS